MEASIVSHMRMPWRPLLMCAVFDHHRWQTFKEGGQKVRECLDCHRRDPPNGPHPYGPMGVGGGGDAGAF